MCKIISAKSTSTQSPTSSPSTPTMATSCSLSLLTTLAAIERTWREDVPLAIIMLSAISVSAETSSSLTSLAFISARVLSTNCLMPSFVIIDITVVVEYSVLPFPVIKNVAIVAVLLTDGFVWLKYLKQSPLVRNNHPPCDADLERHADALESMLNESLGYNRVCAKQRYWLIQIGTANFSTAQSA